MDKFYYGRNHSYLGHLLNISATMIVHYEFGTVENQNLSCRAHCKHNNEYVSSRNYFVALAHYNIKTELFQATIDMYKNKF